jgi:phosphoserine phosphatase RsbU/P
MALIRYVDDAGQLQTRTLDTEAFVIGRAASCQIVFDSDMISREHARIEIEKDGRFRLRDLGSRNRTYVNGELITETLLTGGDVVRTGDRVFEFLDDAVTPDRLDGEFLTPDRSEPPNSEWIKLKAPISLNTAQVEQLAQIAADQPLTARAEDIASAALGQLVLDLQAERGFIALRGESKTEIKPIAHRAMAKSPSGSRTPVSQTFALAPLLQSVGGRYPQTAGQIDTKLGYAATAMIAPLVFRGETIGVVYVDRPHARKPFTPQSLQHIMAAGAYIGSLLGEASRKLARYAPREGLAWMNTLRRVQRAITLPIKASDTFDVSQKQYPGRVRCGDLGDVIHLDEQRCCITVVDGGGHGITGLSQSHALRAALRAAVSASEDTVTDPSAAFDGLNRMMASSTARQVIPCLFASIDMAAGKLTYINAGCAPPLMLIGPGRLVTLDQPSLVLGVDEQFDYEPTRVDLPESFRLICYTDGLIHANNAGGEALGDNRLHEALLDREAFQSAASVLARIGNVWNSHMMSAHPDDDALVIVVGRG